MEKTGTQLTEREVDILNHIIRLIYQVKNSETMRKQVLTELKKLIVFKFSVFSLGVLRNKTVYLVDCVTVSDFEKSFEEQFVYLSESTYDESDYASWIFQIPETVVYRDSDVVNDALRRKTSYYKEYLLANDLPNVAGISIVSEGRFLGALTLYKTEKDGDFTEREMFILDFLKTHFETRLAQDDLQMGSNKKNISYLLKSNYKMTSREIEILGLVFKGKSNGEIAELLVISANTVKKHLSHIYEKTGLSTRSQLVQFVLDNDIAHLW